MLERLDRNGNGMLDPDEMEGPARFIIERARREDPSIRTDRPIPLSKLQEAFSQARSDRDSSGSGRGGSRDDERQALNEAMQVPPPLVPGFGAEESTPEPLLGFGPAAEWMAVTVTPADIQAAEDALRRYDRNRDGYLSGNEISSRWTGNPMDFDRNGDGKLSLNELAVRAARMRVAREEIVTVDPSPRDEDRWRDRDRADEIPDPYHGRQSFAMAPRQLPDGLPSWFAERDADGDQQVSMAEFASRWTPQLVEEFQNFDLNGDGVITVAECLEAVRRGATASVGSGGSSLASDASSSSGSSSPGRSGRSGYGSRTSRSGSDRSSDDSASQRSSGGAADELDEKIVAQAERIIARADTNGDGVLTPDEWKKMLFDPSDADTNKDGRITLQEYARWMQSRQAN